MSTHDTPAQQRGRRREADEQEPDDTGTGGAEQLRERQERLDDDVDSILDEIDEVLEENAEEWVRSFVQKGGE